MTHVLGIMPGHRSPSSRKWSRWTLSWQSSAKFARSRCPKIVFVDFSSCGSSQKFCEKTKRGLIWWHKSKKMPYAASWTWVWLVYCGAREPLRTRPTFSSIWSSILQKETPMASMLTPESIQTNSSSQQRPNQEQIRSQMGHQSPWHQRKRKPHKTKQINNKLKDSLPAYLEVERVMWR